MDKRKSLEEIIKHQISGDNLSTELFMHSNDGIIILDEEFNIMIVNSAYEKIIGYTFEELVKKQPRELISVRTDETILEIMFMTLKEYGITSGEIIQKRKNGEEFFTYVTITKLNTDENQRQYYVGIIKDITQRGSSHAKLEHLANHDALTGVPNRLFFSKSVNQRIKTSTDTDKFSIVFVDLDHFKHINDTYGHHVGDLFLKKISERIRVTLRGEDIVGRYGGDEFILLLYHIDDESSVEKAVTRIMRAFEEPVMTYGSIEFKASLSIGASIFPKDGKTIDDLISKADFAMYLSKEKGRNQYHLFNKEMEKSDKYNRFKKR